MAEKQEILVANLTLDTYQKNNIPPLVIPQGDYGARVIRVRITEQGRPVTVTTSEAASIVAERIGDGESKAFSGTVNEDGTINVPVTQWMLDLPDDDVICHVVITGNDYQYSTTEFLIEPKQKANPTEIAKDDPRQDIVTEILANESARQAAEATRRANETGRESAEDAREEAESKRLQDEEIRTANEALRVTAESEREAAEDQRAAAESERAISEAGRKKEIETLDQRITKTEKRLTNIEQGVMADSFEVDDSVSYVKDVPTNALPYAAISKVGGMTYKDGDVLRSASATGVESVGINIWDEEWEVGYIDLASGALMYDASLARSKNFVPVEPSVTYYMHNGSWNDYRIAFYDNSKNIISAVSTNPFTTPQNCHFIKFYWSGTKYNHDICINKSNSTINGNYYPFTRNTLPIAAEVKALDGYGIGISDTCYNYIDYEKKQFVKRVGVVDMGTQYWSKSTNAESNTYYTIIHGMQNARTDAERKTGWLCEKYDASSVLSASNLDNKSAIRYTNNSTFYVRDDDYTDAASFKAAMAGVMLYYELAEPIVTDLSNILTDDNLIGVEGGGTITMANEHEYAVPSEIIYQVKGVSV
jgi:hypothetical protein